MYKAKNLFIENSLLSNLGNKKTQATD